MTPEDEEFNRIEMESRIRKEAVLQALRNENERLGLYKDVYKKMELQPRHTIHELMEELALARMLIRELGDRLAKLEKPWIGLTHGEVVDIYDQAIKADVAELVDNFARALETKLKEKNHD